MRSNFLVKFLTTFAETIKDISVGLSKVPYKGFRYSDLSMSGYEGRRKYAGFKNLEYRGLIENKSGGSFIFTKKGQKWLNKSLRGYFIDKASGKWDKKWRIVIFDIPQDLHKYRVKFRKKIKSLGLEMLQKSVFVFPYPCEEEIGDIAGDLGVSDYVDIIVAESIGSREKEFKIILKL